MSRNPEVRIESLSALRPVEGGTQAILLRNQKFSVEVSVLAEDLFRLRIVRDATFSDKPSWAVVNQEWPETPVAREFSRSSVTLSTQLASFQWGLKDASWQLVDAHGLTVFSSAKATTGYLDHQPRLALDLIEDESLHGLGETVGPFNRRGSVRDFWNIDVLGHAPAIHPGLRSLYVSIPFGISLRHGRAAAVFWDNPARQIWDLGQSRQDRWQLSAASGEIDVYLFVGPLVSSIVSRYTQLTGRMPLPPVWGLGYHQCRYSYESAQEVLEIARQLRRRKLPCDAIYLDIHHLDGHRVFTFGKNFPEPGAMIRRLKKQGFQVVAIVDPGVKDDPKFGVLKRGLAGDVFVKDAGGVSDYIGEVWPGPSRFPDFLNVSVRDWWGAEQSVLTKLGIQGIWNDMNEPANFGRPDKTLPPDAIHRTDAGSVSHEHVHNVYGMEMARASREGMLRNGNGRPFVITRAGYAGIQRYALVWTGDNSSSWEHLNDSVQMLLNLSLSGVAYCGADVGGFLDNCTPELFVRWLQLGVFTPFFRNHSNTGTNRQEPWALGERVEAISQTFLNLRYQLMPYLYSLMAEAHRSGTPVMRSMLWHYQNDPVAAALGDQFLIGPDLLVAPMLQPGCVARVVYLPNDVWYDFWTGERLIGGRHVVAEAPLDVIPLYVRAGALLPFDVPRQSTRQRAGDTVVLNYWPGVSGHLDWYEDDGETNYYAAGVFCRRRITSRVRGRTLRLHFAPTEGSYTSRVKTWRIIIWHAGRPAKLKIDGRPASGTHDVDQKVFLAEIANSPQEISIEFSGV